MTEATNAIDELKIHLLEQGVDGLPGEWFPEAVEDKFLVKISEDLNVYRNNHDSSVQVAFVHVGDFNLLGSGLSEVLPESGELLSAAISKGMNFAVNEVCFVTVKDESEKELNALSEYLKSLKLKAVVILGHHGTEFLLGSNEQISKLRGSWQTTEFGDAIATYHPNYIVKSPSHKKDFWEDLKKVLKKLETGQ